MAVATIETVGIRTECEKFGIKCIVHAVGSIHTDNNVNECNVRTAHSFNLEQKPPSAWQSSNNI
jgi:hypothetical protein